MKKIKGYISSSELNFMLKAQKRGFKDLAEIYGTFWLNKSVAQECNPRTRFVKYELVLIDKLK